MEKNDTDIFLKQGEPINALCIQMTLSLSLNLRKDFKSKSTN